MEAWLWALIKSWNGVIILFSLFYKGIPSCLNSSPFCYHHNLSYIRFLSYCYQSYGSLSRSQPFSCNSPPRNCFLHSISTNAKVRSFQIIHFIKSLTQKCLSWRDTMTRSEANIVTLTLGLTFSFKFTNFCMVILIYIWYSLFYSLSIYHTRPIFRFAYFFMHLSILFRISLKSLTYEKNVWRIVFGLCICNATLFRMIFVFRI